MTELITAQRAHALQIVRRMHDLGYEAYFAGGCVRDQLLGQSPKDYDIATSALPDQVEQAFETTIPVGKSFGVIRVLDPGNHHVVVEVATFRSDASYLDGRHPSSVTFTNAKEDAQRRDFTINGMFYDPLDDKIIDYVGGKRDLAARVIRAIGTPKKRFEEDKLRLLRAVRFACRLNFMIDDATWEAICEQATQLDQVSVERITIELNLMLTGVARGRAMQLLLESGLLETALPELAALPHDTLAKSFGTLDLADQDRLSLGLVWSILLTSLGTQSGKTLQRLKQPNALIEEVSWVSKHCDINPQALSKAAFKRLLRAPHIETLLTLLELHALILGKEPEVAHICRKQLSIYEKIGPQALNPPMLLDGNDLKSLNIPQGPIYKQLLDELEDMMLEDKVATRDEAIAFVRARQKEIAP